MTEDATREWLYGRFIKKEHWKLKSACHSKYIFSCSINVTRLAVDCATDVINAICYLCKLTLTGMSQSPLKQTGGDDSVSDGLQMSRSSESEASAMSTGTDEANMSSAARKRSQRFSRAFALNPIQAAPPKLKPTNSASTSDVLGVKSIAHKSTLGSPSKITEESPTESDSSEVSKTNMHISMHVNRGLVTGTDNAEFDYLRIKTCQRSASLKSQITPPGIPRRKKAVRFADALGLDLTYVRQIMDIDEYSYQAPDVNMRNMAMRAFDPIEMIASCYLMPLFSQPACLPNFFSAVKASNVLLENCLVHDGPRPSVSGIVRVSNIGYHKQVFIHYTIDKWISCQDVVATYVPNSSDGETDRFSFHIMLPSNFQPGYRLEMAVKYIVNDQIFWDNNRGKNYVVECYGQMETDDPNDSSWLHFY